MKSTLIIRADASPAIGTGHVMRCLALAQAWQDAGGNAIFAWSEMPAALLARLHREPLDTVEIPGPAGGLPDAEAIVLVARRNNADWVVVDGYRFSPAYYQTLKTGGAKILALDDYGHLENYPADALLNQNLGASSDLYASKTDPACLLLLGPRHALLRREFRAAAGIPRASRAARQRVIVSFGGADAENYTAAILANLIASARRNLDLVVLAGAANPHVPALRRLAAAAPFPCEIRVDCPDVAAVMTWADAAITAAGSTVWELASLRLPALIGAHEANQIAGLEALRTVPGFRVWTVDELLARDLATELDTLPASSNADLDTRGAERVVALLRTISVHAQPDLLSA